MNAPRGSESTPDPDRPGARESLGTTSRERGGDV